MQREYVAQVLPAAWVLGGVLVGLVAYLLVSLPLRRLARDENWSVIAQSTSALGTVVVLWGALLGAYLAIHHAQLSAHWMHFSDRTLSAFFVLSLTWLFARAAGAAITSYGRHTDQRLFSASLYSSLAQGLILLIGLLTVLSSLGIAIAPLLTTLGLGGLAVALALNDTLTNLFAGVHIVAARQMRPGDYVRFDFGVEGEIIDIKWHNTTIRDPQNDVVVIPNSKVNASVFTNYSMTLTGLILPVTATLAWKGTFEDLHQLALDAAQAAVAQRTHVPERAKCEVHLSALNETNVQLTALLPLGGVESRQEATSAFLMKLYDAARAANMGAG